MLRNVSTPAEHMGSQGRISVLTSFLRVHQQQIAREIVFQSPTARKGCHPPKLCPTIPTDKIQLKPPQQSSGSAEKMVEQKLNVRDTARKDAASVRVKMEPCIHKPGNEKNRTEVDSARFSSFGSWLGRYGRRRFAGAEVFSAVTSVGSSALKDRLRVGLELVVRSFVYDCCR